jgi:hypothetical protein
MNLLDINMPVYNNDLYNTELLKKIKNVYNPSVNPFAILTMGSSGTGKSYTLKQFKYYKNFLIIDYDEIALQLPELLYNKQNGIYDSNFYEKNYYLISDFTEDIFNKALDLKVNMICNSIIPSYEKIKKLQSNGYIVIVLYKKDEPSLLKRRKERLLKTHLFTKMNFVKDTDVEEFTKNTGIIPFEMTKWIQINNIRDYWDNVFKTVIS